MKSYFLITGVFCVLYYIILAVYSRKLRSTFAVFWLFGGGVHLILGCMPLPLYILQFLKVLCILCWAVFLLVEIYILSYFFRRKNIKADILIVLGAQVRGTMITDSLKRRLDRAADYLRLNPDIKVIVSGGQGPGENITEADAMADYLIKNGIDDGRIIRERKSTSTRENFRFSGKYLDTKMRVGVVTNDFHICRAMLLAAREGYSDPIAVPASSNPVFELNYLVREFFAVLSVWMKGVCDGKRKNHVA